jgi:hypothetical protein
MMPRHVNDGSTRAGEPPSNTFSQRQVLEFGQALCMVFRLHAVCFVCPSRIASGLVVCWQVLAASRACSGWHRIPAVFCSQLSRQTSVISCRGTSMCLCWGWWLSGP